MRVCGVCKLAFRLNDPGGTCDVPPGNSHGASPGHYSCCSECCAAYEPLGPAPHRVMELGLGVGFAAPALRLPPCNPDGTYTQMPAGLCGLCRRYAREDDSMQAVRLWREDFRPGEEAERDRLILPHNEAECYLACRECRRRWAPRILERLVRLGIAPAGLKPEQMPPTMLA